jgi:hypothetical protein
LAHGSETGERFEVFGESAEEMHALAEEVGGVGEDKESQFADREDWIESGR